MKFRYVHGYSAREAQRLQDQASSVRDLLHHDTRYRDGARVLEVGCGVGAQTLTLAKNSPGARFACIDIAADSLRQARALARVEALANVELYRASLFALPFAPESFDHAFVCYVLEHMIEPRAALRAIVAALKPGGSLTVIEGDHGSCYWHPETALARRAWNSLIEAQARLGANSLIGRELHGLLRGAGLQRVQVSPRLVYGDRSHPQRMDLFWRKTIIPMVTGVGEAAAETLSAQDWQQGLRDLELVIDNDEGSFSYTFFKALGWKAE